MTGPVAPIAQHVPGGSALTAIILQNTKSHISVLFVTLPTIYIYRFFIFNFILPYMSLAKYESDVKYIALPQNEVYQRLSNLNNLASIKERLAYPEVQEKLADQIPADKIQQLSQYVEGMTFTEDSLSINSPLGQIVLRIIEREEPKCLKFASEGAPIQLYLWIQLLPHSVYETKLKVTVGAEVNFFMKGMVAKPLQQAANGLAQMLTALR